MDERDVDLLVEHIKKQSNPTRKYEDASDEVIQLAQELVDSCDELALASEARIKYLFVQGSWSKMGECSKTTGKWRHLTGYDFVITVHRDTWETLSINQKKALLHHELSHIMKTPKDKWAIANHDVEEFFATVSRFGSWRPELQAMKQVLAASGEQDEQKALE